MEKTLIRLEKKKKKKNPLDFVTKTLSMYGNYQLSNNLKLFPGKLLHVVGNVVCNYKYKPTKASVSAQRLLRERWKCGTQKIYNYVIIWS
jgi:hypothetical protein